MRRRVILSILLVVVLIGFGGGVSYVFYLIREAPPRTEAKALPPLVEAVRVRARDVRESFIGYGSVAPDRSATLSAEVAGAVVEVVSEIEAGDAVEADQVLIRLDDRSHQQALDRAIAEVEAAEAQLAEVRAERESLEGLLATAAEEVRIAGDEQRRVSDLFENGQANKREFDLARLAYQQALRVRQTFEKELGVLDAREKRLAASRRSLEAQQEIARLSVERCEIRAPFAGRIDTMHVDLGDLVQPGQAVLDLVDASRVEIAVQLPTSVHGRVSVGSPCRLAPEGGDDRAWTGRVVRLAPLADARMRTFAAYVEVDNAAQPEPLLPGSFVRAVVDGPVRENRITIPRGAIRRGHVLIAENGQARRRGVTVERLIADEALVSGEIAGGDVLITSHLDSLTDKAAVRLPKELTQSPGDDAPDEAASSDENAPAAHRAAEASP